MTKGEMLNLLFSENKNCKNCILHKTRTNFVFGEGNPEASIMLIGEAPGKNEDFQGRPFVGRSGELLTSIIEKGMKLRRDDVYIANIIKCRPSIRQEMKTDRPPNSKEVEACSTILLKQIDIISPRVIVTLGNPSTKFLLKTTEGITRLRGKKAYFKNIPVIPTYHPSYVLRNGGNSSPLKKDVWEDIKKVMKIAEVS